MPDTSLYNGTIAAIATPYGKAGIGIIRISGPQSLETAEKLFRSSKNKKIESHRLYHGHFLEPSGIVLDEVLPEACAYGGVGICGGDPVSPEAASAFNERINGLVMSCVAYNRDLQAAAAALDDTARAYGYTDDEIAASYSPGS